MVIMNMETTQRDGESINLNPEIHLITEKIIGCAFKVSNGLGSGFLEKVYENALVHELHKIGVSVQQQVLVPVTYDGINVGEYVADLLVENIVLIELKVVQDLNQIHFAQCMNYLRATGLPVCLLMNFYRPKLQYKRILHPHRP